jgi:hypothetical protein
MESRLEHYFAKKHMYFLLSYKLTNKHVVAEQNAKGSALLTSKPVIGHDPTQKER